MIFNGFLQQNHIQVEEGWIKLHRKLLDSQVFQSEGLLKVWIWCLLKANHKDNWVSVKTGRGITEVLVRRGQFIFGRETASKELKMAPRTVYDRMQKLARMQNLAIQPATHYSIVTIQNYNHYQKSEIINPTSNPTPNQHPTNTNKNDDNKNNNLYADDNLQASKEGEDLSSLNSGNGKLTPEDIHCLYKKLCPNLPQVRELTRERRTKVLARIKAHPELKFWREVLEMANQSYIPPTDGHPNGWKPDFDYLIRNDTNLIKVLEGKFLQKPKSSW